MFDFSTPQFLNMGDIALPINFLFILIEPLVGTQSYDARQSQNSGGRHFASFSLNSLHS